MSFYFPDVVAYDLNHAKKILEESGIHYKVIETKAPRTKTLDGEYRVVKQHTLNDQLIITVCQIPDGICGEIEDLV